MDIQTDELFRIGNLLETHGDWSLAGNVYIHLLRKNIRAADSYTGLGRVLVGQGRLSQAISLLEQGLNETSSDAVRAQLVMAYEAQLAQPGLNANESFETASKCLQSGFSDTAIRTLIRHAAPLGKQLEAAILIERSLEQTPPPAGYPIHSLMNAAAILAIQGENPSQARALIDAALESNPSHPESLRLFELLKSS
jgi:tetratricopeptide (TPR) repeat protein